jgi:pimeloyl-ACP methyl ester carboxylesterase
VTQSRWSDLDGQTHWLDVGGPVDAPPLVAVHGLGGSHTNWLAVAPDLATDHRVYALDLAGHGDTPAEQRGTDVAANERLLHRFIVEVVGEPVTLLGNSMGGMVSLRQAAHHPDTAREVILLGPALPLGGRRLHEPLVAAGVVVTGIPRLGAGILASRRSRMTPEQQVADMLKICCVHPERVPDDVVDEMIEMARRRADYVGVELAIEQAARSTIRGVLSRRSYNQLLDHVQAPVLILHGEKDRLVPVESSRRAVAAHPGWTLVTGPDLGHVPQLEDPEWTVAQIRQWQAERGYARSTTDPPSAG